jgi:hypothetical protein
VSRFRGISFLKARFNTTRLGTDPKPAAAGGRHASSDRPPIAKQTRRRKTPSRPPGRQGTDPHRAQWGRFPEFCASSDHQPIADQTRGRKTPGRPPGRQGTDHRRAPWGKFLEFCASSDRPPIAKQTRRRKTPDRPRSRRQDSLLFQAADVKIHGIL